MGLDTSHGCWHGAYSSFNRWRTEIAKCEGVDLQKMEGFVENGISWEPYKEDPLTELLYHSDCDGNIPWKSCIGIATRLEEILPRLPQGDGGGYIGDWREKTQCFINGLKEAYKNKEDVEFM